MKTVLPKELIELSAAIASKRDECEAIRADIERAAGAATEADRITDELAALSERRAELKAKAFISRQAADLTELNTQEEKLEHASRSAREDGAAAAIAITLLKAQLAEVESKIEQITEERRLLALAWLEDRRERAADRYLALLDDLGGVIAEMAAVDGARPRLGDHRHLQAGIWVRAEWKKLDVPVPFGRKVPIGNTNSPNYVTPIRWLRDYDHGKPELGALLAQLRAAGVLPTTADTEALP